METLEQIDKARLPQHIAIIMDGNGRWAEQQGMDRILGHQYGIKAVREVTEACAQLGVRYLTLYVFSTENWNRPSAEIEAIMALLVQTIHQETETLNQNNVRLRSIGDLNRLPQAVRAQFEECMALTAHNTGLNLVLALSYSSRWEITQAVQQLGAQIEKGELKAADIDENCISHALNTKDIPDPDLLIRTSGELRISNFLLWQLAYTELYFTSVWWPNFDKAELYKAILNYQQRERRFGKTSQQVH